MTTKTPVTAITKTIESYGFDFKAFSDLLKETGSILSGSLILNALLPNEDVWLSDMDIYVPFSAKEKVSEFLVKQGYKGFMGSEHELEEFTGTYKSNPMYNADLEKAYVHLFYLSIEAGHRPRVRTPIRDVWPFSNGKCCIDLVICKSEDPLECLRFFDFSMLLNWYDGRNIYAAHMKAVTKEEDPILNSTGNPILDKRVYKYGERRGYKITKEFKYTYSPKYDYVAFTNPAKSFTDIVKLDNPDLQKIEVIAEGPLTVWDSFTSYFW